MDSDREMNTPPIHSQNTNIHDDNDMIEEIRKLSVQLETLWNRFEKKNEESGYYDEGDDPTGLDVANGGGEMKVTPPEATRKRVPVDGGPSKQSTNSTRPSSSKKEKINKFSSDSCGDNFILNDGNKSNKFSMHAIYIT